MKPIPFVYVKDMERSIEWYTKVLGSPRLLSTSPYWSELESDGSVLALHGADEIEPGGAAGISFVVSETLEEFVARLESEAITPLRGIRDEVFGRSLVLEDPDGFRFQVNEYRD